MEIIKDQSPYYISFADNNIQQIIQLASSLEVNQWRRISKFSHEPLPIQLAEKILDLVPSSKALELNVNRVSSFVSQPGLYYGAHKDGLSLRFGINYPMVIQDGLCVTNWYDDSIADGKHVVTLGGKSREIAGFRKGTAPPRHSVSFQLGNPVLFNTDLYHDWDNSQSKNIRVVLTLRSSNSDITFDDARGILFR